MVYLLLESFKPTANWVESVLEVKISDISFVELLTSRVILLPDFPATAVVNTNVELVLIPL